MNKKDNKRIAAEALFVENGHDGKRIAELLEIPEATVSRWRKKYGWEKKRLDTVNNPTAITQLVRGEILKLLKGEQSEINADAISKLYKIHEGFAPTVNPGIVVAVMQEYDKFLLAKNPELALANLPYNKEFIISQIEKGDF